MPPDAGVRALVEAARRGPVLVFALVVWWELHELRTILAELVRQVGAVAGCCR